MLAFKTVSAFVSGGLCWFVRLANEFGLEIYKRAYIPKNGQKCDPTLEHTHAHTC